MKNKNSTLATNIDNRQRRQLLLGLSSLIGTAAASKLLGGNAVSVAMAYSESSERTQYQAKLFTLDQLASLKVICQTVIPATDTPGAGDVDTHQFIDNQLHHCFDKAAHDSVHKSVALIDERAELRHKSNFRSLPLSQATVLLSDLDTGENGFTKTQTSNFKFLKSVIVFGYYTSEIGASTELSYDAVPGGFKGNVPLEEIGSAWGSRAYF